MTSNFTRPRRFSRTATRLWLLLLASLLFVLLPILAFAQSSLIGDVASERTKYGASMSPAQVATMLNQVAWNHRNEGWGLLRKGSGNSCPLRDTFISCDILVHAPTIQHFDVLQDAENTARPQWNNVGPCVLSDSSGCAMDKFLAPFDPGGPVLPPPVVTPVPIPMPPTAPAYVDLSPVYTRLDSLAAQAERIYADMAARDAARALQIQAVDQRLERHDNDPSWVRKFFTNSNTYVAIAGVMGGFLAKGAAK